jgi:hypothetical protein
MVSSGVHQICGDEQAIAKDKSTRVKNAAPRTAQIIHPTKRKSPLGLCAGGLPLFFTYVVR